MARAEDRDRLAPRRTVGWKLFGGVIALVLLGVELVSSSREHDAQRSLEQATDRLGACIFGDPVADRADRGALETDEAVLARALARVRATQLTAMGVPPEQRLARPDLRWPARCAAYAGALASEERRRGSQARGVVTDRLAAAFEANDSEAADWSAPLSAWLLELRAVGRTLGRHPPGSTQDGGDDTPEPPTPAHAETVDSLDRKALALPSGLPLGSLRFAPSLEHGAAFFVDPSDRTSAETCTYDDGRARCAPKADTADAPARAHATALAGETELDVSSHRGFLVSKRFTTDAAGLRLRVREIHDGQVAPEVDVGQVGEVPRAEVSDEEPQIQACRSGSSIALRVRGWDAEYFSFRKDFRAPGTWSRPVLLEGSHGAMTCRGSEVTLLDLRGHVESNGYEPVVTESRCTPDVCRTRTLQTRELFANDRDIMPEGAGDVRAVAVEDKLLLVWRAGEVGGLRMRLGKLDELAASASRERNPEDVVLFDDHMDAGRFRHDSTLLGFDVHPVSDGALLMLTTRDGTFLYRVDAAGRLTSVPVE